MNKCNIQLVFPEEAKSVLGTSAIPEFIDDSNPPLQGDQIRLNGLTLVVKARVWNLDVKPPTLVLELGLLAPQS